MSEDYLTDPDSWTICDNFDRKKFLWIDANGNLWQINAKGEFKKPNKKIRKNIQGEIE